jgi:hypothetical protein
VTCFLQANWRQTALSLLHQAAEVAAAAAAAVHAEETQPTNIYTTTDSSNGCTVSQVQQLAEDLATAVAAAANPAPAVPGFTSDFLNRRWCRSHACLSGFLPPADQVPRVDQSTLNPVVFQECYDEPAQPVILTGYMDAEWPEGRAADHKGIPMLASI